MVCPSPNNGIEPAPAQISVNAVPQRDLQNFYLARLNSNPIQMFKGDIAEVLVYTRLLSDSEKQLVSGYLKNKYKL
jgi:hypothetical protein